MLVCMCVGSGVLQMGGRGEMCLKEGELSVSVYEEFALCRVDD